MSLMLSAPCLGVEKEVNPKHVHIMHYPNWDVNR